MTTETSALSPGAWRPLLLFLYFCSGAIGLCYEVLWAREMALLFGISILGVVVTVAAFMVGLGAGAWWLANRTVASPLHWVALLEGGVGLYAWFQPFLVGRFDHWLMTRGAGMSVLEWRALISAASFFLLAIPATALGAGFPLILKSPWVKRQVGLPDLYGVNTLGAVIGALLPLFLLPVVGWSSNLQWAGFGGILLGLAWAVVAYLQESGPTNPSLAPSQVPVRPARRILLGYMLVGVSSLALEVAWTRLFGLILLRTEYVLALILAVYLAGVGLGSLVARSAWVDRLQSWLPLVAATGILLGLGAVPTLSAWVESAHWNGFYEAMFKEALALGILTFPVTLVLGAWLPVLSRHTQGGGMWLYGVNALGGAAGALLVGWVMLPAVGTVGSVVCSALLLLVAGWVTVPRRPVGQWGASILLLLAAGYLWHPPGAAQLLPQSLAGSRDLFRYEDAIAMTQVVEQADGQRLLLTDLQRRDASSDPTAVFVQANQGRLPVMLHPHPASVLFLGLGTGISVSGIQGFPGLTCDAVELSGGAIEGAREWFAPFNREALNRCRVHQDDARHFLMAEARHYDVIVGDLYHPDLAGSGALLSLQQFWRVRQHLGAGGIFVQWIALNQFDGGTLAVLFHTFLQVFPDGRLFLDGLHLALVGPQGHWQGGQAMADNLARLDQQQRQQVTGGEGLATWWGRYWGKIPDSAQPLQDEWAPVIDFELPLLKYRDNDLSALLTGLRDHRPDAVLAAQEMAIPTSDLPAFRGAYQATQWLVDSWIDSFQNRNGEAQGRIRMAYETNPRDRWVGYAVSDSALSALSQGNDPLAQKRRVLEKLRDLFPWQSDVLRALWQIQVEQKDVAGSEQTRRQWLQSAPLDREARKAKNDGFSAP